MKHLEVQFRKEDAYVPGPGNFQLTQGLWEIWAQDAMESLRRTAHIYYGRLDLEGREKWKCEPVPGGSFLSEVQLRAMLGLPHIPNDPDANRPTTTKVNREWVISAWLDSEPSVIQSDGTVTGREEAQHDTTLKRLAKHDIISKRLAQHGTILKRLAQSTRKLVKLRETH